MPISKIAKKNLEVLEPCACVLRQLDVSSNLLTGTLPSVLSVLPLQYAMIRANLSEISFWLIVLVTQSLSIALQVLFVLQQLVYCEYLGLAVRHVVVQVCCLTAGSALETAALPCCR